MSDRRNPKVRRSKWDKVLKIPGYNYTKSFYTGFVWTYTNCMGKDYHSELTDRGWKCDCPGFSFHGKCKHVYKFHKLLTSNAEDRKYSFSAAA